MKTAITRQDIISMEEFEKIRAFKRKEIMEIKKNRRLDLGKDVSIIFENYDTLWWQIHEMLYIEKGGEAQVEDELQAYSPLVPKGNELVATLMIEIDDPIRRAQVLGELGGVERCIFLKPGSTSIAGVPEEDPNRTTETGKTSSVHFIRWPFKDSEIAAFSHPHERIMVEIDHPRLHTHNQMPEAMRVALAQDF